MFFILEISRGCLRLSNVQLALMMPLLKVELVTTGIFIVAMITRALILIMSRHRGSRILSMYGQTNGKKMVKYIWRKNKIMASYISTQNQSTACPILIIGACLLYTSDAADE